MTRLHYVKKARKPIYNQGKVIDRKMTRGKNKGMLKAVTDKSQPAGKNDKCIVRKGEPYYWWQFAFGPKQVSKERPRRSALTQSEYLGTLWDLEDAFGQLSTSVEPSGLEDVAVELEGWADEVEQLGESQAEKRENMPEQLQDSESGSLLERRAERCEELAGQLGEAAENIRGAEVAEDEEGSELDISDYLGDVDWSDE